MHPPKATDVVMMLLRALLVLRFYSSFINKKEPPQHKKMHWISLYDVVLLVLLCSHVVKPGDGYMRPALLLVGFIAKQMVMLDPLLVTRVLVLLISLVQVYVCAPLVNMWHRCRRQRSAASYLGEMARPEITCVHNFRDMHHVATSSCVCQDSSAYRVRYEWHNKHYSMLLPATDSPRKTIAECVQRLSVATPPTNRIVPPLIVSSLLFSESSAPSKSIDITAGVLELLGPERDGHAALSGGMSSRVRPLNLLVWMATSADDTSDAASGCGTAAATTNIITITVEYRNGTTVKRQVNDADFTVADMVRMCTRRPSVEAQ